MHRVHKRNITLTCGHTAWPSVAGRCVGADRTFTPYTTTTEPTDPADTGAVQGGAQHFREVVATLVPGGSNTDRMHRLQLCTQCSCVQT